MAFRESLLDRCWALACLFQYKTNQGQIIKERAGSIPPGGSLCGSALSLDCPGPFRAHDLTSRLGLIVGG